MLNRIEIQRKDGGVLTLPIYDSTDFTIKEIQGLDPVRANIVTSNFAHIDGTQFQSSRREMRNLIFTLLIDSMNPFKTVQELRKDLYSFLMPKTNITIRFIRSNTDILTISGQVESFDAPIFVKEPQANISILCFDPDFKDINNTLFSGTTVTTATDTDVLYTGEVDSGFIFTLYPNATTTTFTLQNTLSDGSVKKLIFESLVDPILAGEVITISTIPGDKYVRLTKNGNVTSILWGLDPASEWVSLYPGTNKIRVSSNNANMSYAISYYTRFGGL